MKSESRTNLTNSLTNFQAEQDIPNPSAAAPVKTNSQQETLKASNTELNDEELELAKYVAQLDARKPANPTRKFHPTQQQEVERAISVLGLLEVANPSAKILRPSDIGGDSIHDTHSVLQPDFETEPPQRIGNFEVVKELGRGGFGIVFLARDAKLNRQVAVKVPKLECYLSDEARIRFDREARSAALLTHPAIVPVYESGTCGPLPYIATALCQGETLSCWFNTNQKLVAPRLAAQIVSRLSDAMQHAHSRGVIHRDLKPSNILIDLEDSSHAEPSDLIDALRITDFGLASSTDDRLATKGTPLTENGAIIGTPEYMSPEQVQSLPCSEATDIYSLGVILYELLTGDQPFKNENRLKLLQSIQSHDPKPLRSQLGTIPVDLQAICLKCLEKEPTKRYRDCHSLTEDLSNFLDSKPVSARPVTLSTRFGRWCKRQPLIASLVATILLVTLAGFATVYSQWQIAQSNLTEAIKQKQRSDLFLAQSENAIDQMLNRAASSMAEIPGLAAIRQDLLDDALRLQTAILDQESENQKTSARTIAAHARLARIQIELGRFEEAKSNCDQALELYAQMDERNSELEHQVVGVLNNLASLHLTRHDPEATQQTVDQALKILEKLNTDANPANTVLIKSRLLLKKASALDVQNLPLKADEVYNTALELLTEASNSESSTTSQVNEKLTARSRMPSKAHLLSTIDALNGSAMIQKRLGNTKSTKAKLKLAIELATNPNPSLVEDRDLQQKLAESYLKLGGVHILDYENEAAKDCNFAATEIMKELAQRWPMIYQYQRLLGSSLGGLSISQLRLDQQAEAIKTITYSIEVQKRCLALAGNIPKQRKILGTTYTNLGNAISDLQLKNTTKNAPIPGTSPELEQAITNWIEADKIHSSLIAEFPDSPIYLHRSSLNLAKWGKAFLWRGRYAEAETKYEMAILEGQKALDISPQNPAFENNLVNLLHRQIIAKCGMNKHADVRRLMESLKQLCKTPKHCLDAAVDLTKCVDILSDGRVPPDETTKEQYLEASFLFLNKAIGLDSESVERIKSSEAYQSLRSDRRFKW